MTKVKDDLANAKSQYLEVNDKNNSLHQEIVKQALYILELQTTVSKGVEESGQLQRDLKKVQDLLASVEQTSTTKEHKYSTLLAEKENENSTLRVQLSKQKDLIRSQRQLLSSVEEDENRLRERITKVEAQNAKLESNQRNIKAKEKKKITEVYQAKFKT